MVKERTTYTDKNKEKLYYVYRVFGERNEHDELVKVIQFQELAAPYETLELLESKFKQNFIKISPENL